MSSSPARPHGVGRALKEIEPITGLYGAFVDLGDLERHVIDSGGQAAEDTAAEIRLGRQLGRHILFDGTRTTPAGLS
jgi:hypothetical protein